MSKIKDEAVEAAVPEWNPVTGKAEVIAKPDEMDGGFLEPVATSTRTGSKMKRSFRKGAKNKDFYSHIVRLGNCKVYFQSISSETSREVLLTSQALINTSNAITSNLKDEKIAPEDKFTPEGAVELIDTDTAAREKVYYDVAKEKIVGWDLPDDDGHPWPCTDENIDELEFSVICDLVDQAIAKRNLSVSQGNA